MYRYFPRRSIGLVVAGVAAACVGVVAPATPAAAVGADSITLAGFGTVSPGYPFTGCYPQTMFAFTGHVTVDLGGNAGVGTSYYDGSSTGCETVGGGAGTGTLTISDGVLGNGGGGGVVSYFRTGTSMTLTGSVTFSGVDYSILLGTCDFWYTDANPATSYQIDCQLLLT